MSDSIEDRLRTFIVRRVKIATPPGDDDRLVESGFMPSVRLLDLVGSLEDEFGVRLRPVDLVPEKLATIRQIAAMVRERLTSSRP